MSDMRHIICPAIFFSVLCPRDLKFDCDHQTSKSTRNPTKSTTNIASAKLRVVSILFFLRFRQFTHHPPQRYHSRKVFCGDGGWFAVLYVRYTLNRPPKRPCKAVVAWPSAALISWLVLSLQAYSPKQPCDPPYPPNPQRIKVTPKVTQKWLLAR